MNTWSKVMDEMQDEVTDLVEMLEEIIQLWDDEAPKAEMENAMLRASRLVRSLQ